jgi:hypothetical protein
MLMEGVPRIELSDDARSEEPGALVRDVRYAAEALGWAMCGAVLAEPRELRRHPGDHALRDATPGADRHAFLAQVLVLGV